MIHDTVIFHLWAVEFQFLAHCMKHLGININSAQIVRLMRLL